MAQVEARPRRAVLVAVALISGIGALGLAASSFDVALPVAPGRSIDVPCRPAAISAWHRGSKEQVALWVVTVDTNMTGPTAVEGDGYAYRSGGEAWCAERARPRLAGAVLLGVGAALCARRARRRV